MKRHGSPAKKTESVIAYCPGGHLEESSTWSDIERGIVRTRYGIVSIAIRKPKEPADRETCYEFIAYRKIYHLTEHGIARELRGVQSVANRFVKRVIDGKIDG